MKNRIALAQLNVKNYKRLSRSARISIIFGSILFLVLATFLLGLRQITENIVSSDYYLQEIRLNVTNIEMESAVLDEVANINHVEDLNLEYILFPSEPAKITLDDKNLYSLYLYGSDATYSSFAKLDILNAFDGEYQNPVIYGRDFTATDEKVAIIDENYVYIFGYASFDEIIGKSISIQIGDILVDDILIVGIFGYEIGYQGLSDKSTLSDSERQDFFARDDNISPFHLSSDIINEFSRHNELEFEDIGQFSVNVFVDDLENVLNVSVQIQDVTVNEIFNDLLYISNRLDLMRNVSIFLMCIVGIIMVVSFVTIVTSLITKIDNQIKLIEIMRKIGYTKKDIKLIYLIENIIITLKSTAVFLGISFAITMLLDIILIPAYSTITEMSKFVFLLDYRVFIIYTFGLLLVTTLLTLITCRNILKGKMGINYD